MKLKELESHLQDIEKFSNPKANLEQYNTSPHLAARIVFTADSVYDDIRDKAVADLGTGSGILGIAAQLLGSSYTVGFDIDEDALGIAQRNIEEFEVEMELMRCNISCLQLGGIPRRFDTVVMNPPFGTKVKGIDTIFLERALQIANRAVYSLHKTSTRNYLLKKAEEWNVDVEVIAVIKFDIPQMYRFHKKKNVDVEVDLIRFQHRTSKRDGMQKNEIPLQ